MKNEITQLTTLISEILTMYSSDTFDRKSTAGSHSTYLILFLEDSLPDVELVQSVLAHSDINCEFHTVKTRQEFIQSLKTVQFDLILANYSLPALDGPSAFKIAQALCPDTPFIVISGEAGADLAIDALKLGVTDYVLKQRLSRLVPSVQQALWRCKGQGDRTQPENCFRPSENLLQAVMNASPVAIITLSPECRVMTWNLAAEHLYGVRAENIIHQPFPFIAEHEWECFQANIQHVLQHEESAHLEMHHYTKTGTDVDLHVTLAPLYDAQNHAYAVVMTAIDITERKREQLARANAEATNRLKDEFLSVLSHELRTPLNPILGWIKLIRKGNLDSATLNLALEAIDRNSTLQIRLIEDLLDMSSVSQGKLTLQISPVDLATLVEATITALRPALETKAIELTLSLSPQLGLVPCDPKRFQQICRNLVSNAIKFTPNQGQIWVRLERLATEAQLQVIDNGIGVDADFLPYMFDNFRQFDASTTRSHGGLGVGLAIARHLVELHGGSIKATSKGQGTTITVKLPYSSYGDSQ